MIALAAFSLTMVSCGDKKGGDSADDKEKTEVKMEMGVYNEDVVKDLCERMLKAAKDGDQKAYREIEKEGDEYFESLTEDEKEKVRDITKKYQEEIMEAVMKAAQSESNSKEEEYSSYDDEDSYDMDSYDMEEEEPEEYDYDY